MAQLTLDLSGRGGLAPRFWGDMDKDTPIPELRIIGGETQMADGIYNPFRRYGYLSPANATFADVTPSTAFDALLGSTEYDVVNDDFYMAERGTAIFKGDGLDDVSFAEEHDLGSTGTPVIMDLQIYELNGTRKIFYIYEKSNNMEIGEAALPIASENDNWLTADVSGSFTNTLTNSAFMRVADNGFAYIFQDNKVHKLDGTSSGGSTGTVTKDVITFPGSYQVTDAIDYRGNMYMCIRQDAKSIHGGEAFRVHNSKLGIYIWDRLSSIVRTRDYIPLEGVKEIRNIFISPQGELRIITVNSERIAEIRQYDGRLFRIIQEIGLIAYPQYPDSLTTFSGFNVWLGRDGIIYAYGKLTKDDKEALYKIGKLPDTIATSSVPSGAILFGGANTDSTSGEFKHTRNALFVSYITGVTNTVKTWDMYGTGADGVNATSLQGDVFTLVKFLPQMSQVKHIDIYMMPGSGSGSTNTGTVKVYFNQSATAEITKTIDRDTSAKGYVRLEINKLYVNSIQLEIEFNSSATPGTVDFAPSFAVVEYEPTTTKG